MASSRLVLLAVAVALVAGFAVGLSSATDHIVGGNRGWNPYINYSLWSGNHTFVGDIISFRYQKGTHGVFEVNQMGYDKCTMDGAAGNWTSGKDFIPLAEPRRYFFIRGSGSGLCQAGMKVVVTVHPLPHNATGFNNATEFHHGPEMLPDCSPDCGTAAASLTAAGWLTVAALAVAIAYVA